MLSTQFIDQVRNLPISEVIGSYISLKRNGANYKASCPFHNEKSASFTVSDVKGIYKCFGCGVSGDAIGFVIAHKKLTFAEACQAIGNAAGLVVEHESVDDTEEYKAKLSAAEAQEKALNYVVPIYQTALHNLADDHPAKIWLNERGISDEIIEEWQLGWAPDDWRFLTPRLIQEGMHQAADKLGIVKRSDASANNYDGYRSRIIFPITAPNGRFIGLGGRYIQINPNDSKDIPKYINPSQCELYNKSNVLYGLKQAAKAIKTDGRVYVVEGYMDVISPYRAGIQNVVGTCGTAFTTDQIKELKKHTSHVVLWRDTDAAGITAVNKHLPDLYKQNIVVQIARYDAKDPDEFIRNQYQDKKAEQPVERPILEDGILWFANQLYNDSETSIQRVEVKRKVLTLLACIREEIYQNHYFSCLCEAWNWKPSDTKKELLAISKTVVMPRDNDYYKEVEVDDEDAPQLKIPDWVDDEQKERFLTQGFISVERKHQGKPMVGYYSFTTSGKTEITNFIIKPLFHIYAGLESRYMLQIFNGYKRAVLDVQAKTIPSPDQFQAYTVTEGPYMIYGTKSQWLRIATELLHQFPRCIEINHLGWQRHKFFAFVDKIFIPGAGIKDLDQWGIIKMKSTDTDSDENFLVPASCEAYRQLQKTGDDPYENDRVFAFKQAPIDFKTWANQMHLVYAEKGPVGVAVVVMSLFRDLIFSVDNNCPHIYAFGEPSSGKSKWAESCTAVFFVKRSAFNLNSGTDFAFFNYMQRFNNAPAHLNEFDIDVIKPEWFQAIKGVYDGEGRERGSMKPGAKNRTEVMRVNSLLFLTGQKLVTADDNSVVSRSIIEPFSVVENRTEKNQQDYQLLKKWEENGLSSILVEILQLRQEFDKDYKENFDTLLGHWRRTKSEARSLNQRILQNFGHMATCYAMAAKHVLMPVPDNEFADYCYKQAIRWSAFIRNSDTLSEFWRMLEFFVSENAVENGWDFIIKEEMAVTVRISRSEEKAIQFTEPTKVLYLRVNNVHKKFESAFRTRTGNQAMSLDNLLHYFSSRKYYLGAIKQKAFKRYTTTTDESNGSIATHKKPQQTITSCYAFMYEDLGISIETYDGNGSEEIAESQVLTQEQTM
jgi:DNA primase